MNNILDEILEYLGINNKEYYECLPCEYTPFYIMSVGAYYFKENVIDAREIEYYLDLMEKAGYDIYKYELIYDKEEDCYILKLYTGVREENINEGFI